jgi:hypothetical protein
MRRPNPWGRWQRPGCERDDWDDDDERRCGDTEPTPSRPAEPPRCPTCSRELIVSFQGIRGARSDLNAVYECGRHGQVIPIQPDVGDVKPGRWGDGFESVEVWRQLAPQPTRTKPRGLREGDVIGAVRARPRPRPTWDEPLPPRSYG